MFHNESLRKKSINSYEPIERIIIGIAGGSAAGKTTICQSINRQMAFDKNFKVEIISLDCFYKSIDKSTIDVREYNFDHPNALDFDKAYQVLLAMKQGKPTVQIPQYSFKEDRRLQTTTKLSPANIIFFQGLMAYYDQRIRDLMTYKIFIHCDDDIRLCRRLIRDTKQRGRSIVSVLNQYNKFVKSSFHQFVEPCIIYADLIIPGFRNNRVSVDFIVQHIKNIARQITFKEKARKTKIYCFGQNQFYDLQYHNSNYKTQLSIEQSSFLVFPTSQSQKKQLQFYISSLLSQSFSYDYYRQVYIYQFTRIIKSLLQQLITLKNYDLSCIEILSVYNLNDLVKIEPGKKYVKIIFVPSAIYNEDKIILKMIKNYYQKYPNKVELVLLNIFADLSFPSTIYQLQLSATMLINLYAITNQKRFREILIANSQLINQSFNYILYSPQLTQIAIKNIKQSIKINNCLTKQFKLKCYQKSIKLFNQKKQNQQKQEKEQPLKNKIELGNITQLPAYQQQHGNICGFHTLSSIITPFQQLTNKEIFIQNFYKFKQLLIPLYKLNQYLQVSDYQPLQRKDLSILINQINPQTTHSLFQNKTICTLYYSFGYIQNSYQELQQLTKYIYQLKNNIITQLYVVMGVMDHYFLTILKEKRIFFIDSQNTNLQLIIGLNDDIKILTRSQKRKKQMKKALKIIQDIYINDKSIFEIQIELKIQEIIGSYNQISDSDIKAKQQWFKQQYTPQVIKSDLIANLTKNYNKISQQHKKMFNNWINNNFVRTYMGEISLVST